MKDNQGLYTNLQDFVESEWFSREFGLNFEYINPREGNSLPRIIGICTEDLDKWHDYLLDAPKSSITVFLVGNEYYDVNTFSSLDDYQSIKAAFVQYLPDVKSKVPIKYIFRVLKSNISILLRREFYSTLLRAMQKHRELSKLEIETTTYLLPLGYTNRFVSELESKGLVDGAESILEKSIETNRRREETICFLGQKGSWFRRLVIEEFKTNSSAPIDSYGGWGGNLKSKSTIYTDQLMNHKFGLCPPGNLCNETPRYFEVICCGAIPIVTNQTLQDWSIFNHWTSDISTRVDKQTHLAIYKMLKQLTHEEYEVWRNSIRARELNRMRTLRGVIWSYLN